MKKIVFILSGILSVLFAVDDIHSDLAFRMVKDRLAGKDIPLEYIEKAFSNSLITTHSEIPERFARPWEKKTWEQYRKIFVKESRINAGATFYKKNKALFDRVVERYNIDPFVVCSIAGIESNYGTHHKGFTVFNSLYTQIHEMPKRAKWASRELASYIEYCYKDHVDPHSIEGSYAGAFGFGQFIPTSFVAYSVDFDEDGVRRPYDWPDVLGSIANYLVRHGYKKGSTDYSKTGNIFKAVRAYNHSDNYVMAVLELASEIKKRSQETESTTD